MVDTRESVTAKLCSFARAYHSNYGKQKIFDDYLAYDMMGKDEYEEIGQLIQHDFEAGAFDERDSFSRERVYPELNEYISPIPISRIAFAEQELLRFAEEHGEGPCQYVICGAGMDTFAFRNENPRIQVFELDHPDTQRYKLGRIRDLEWNIPENVRYVPIDFAKDDMTEVLKDAGFDPAAPAFFAILGVTYYLTLPVFEQTIEKISRISARGNKIVFDFPDETTFEADGVARVRRLTEITAKLGEPMLHGFSVREIEAALRRNGFSIDIHEAPETIQHHFFENRADNQRAFENIHFISAIKKEKETMKPFIFTSESVTKGHPDKVCDMISDSILDAYLAKDPTARVAAETVVKNNTVILVGEISSSAEIDTEQVVRQTIRGIGYNKEELGFDADTAEIIVRLDRQSPDIAQGVDRALEIRNTEAEAELGAGDQGMMFGYATDETPEYMPLAISLAHRLAKRLTDVRENGTLAYLRPDGKTQVSVKYENDLPTGIDTIVVSTQHDPDVSQEQIREDVIREVIQPVIPKEWFTDDIQILVNPTGRFVIGGPVGDSGLTGRKIIVDTYGGSARHGGGAFSGKDPTKVDRSAAYAARYVAKNIVAAGLAKKAEIQLAYAIGVASPVSVNINTYGTGVVSDEVLQEAVTALVDLRPGAIIQTLQLRRPIYGQTAAYGHFGRTDLDLPWERTDLAEKLKAYVREKKS
jgi:S-adenosylmethionine synthetase